MPNQIRIALAQINSTVGDLDGNRQKVQDNIAAAKEAGAHIVIFPELTIPGYPPEDLVLKRKFIVDNRECLEDVASQTKDIVALIGFVHERKHLYNATAVIQNGNIAAIYHKIALPNYSVFDEKRYFEPGHHPLIFELNEIKFGLNICEDMWTKDGITECQGLMGGAEIVLNLSASPYHVEKRKQRLALCAKRARQARAMMVMLNLVGGQDELIFDGNSLVVDHRGELLAEGKQFEEHFFVMDLDVTELREFRKQDASFTVDKQYYSGSFDLTFVKLDPLPLNGKSAPVSKPYAPLPRLAEIYQALILGTRDYVTKNGFKKVVIGLSGGIDSALTAAIAADALGAENVIGIMMPSEYTSDTSNKDAEALAVNLGIQTETVPIKKTFQAYLETMQDLFNDHPSDITEENLQARIRGNILMALSNKFGWLVLTTGNKSETGVGYSTLYGDTAGGFAVIKDVPKTWVYQLCEHRNEQAGKEIIPASILTKPPTAELRPDQKDQDSLPPYELLDSVLEEFVEKDKSVKEIIEDGFPREVVKDVARLVDRSEYKRRQAPPGIKITPKAFGKDRRMPITNRYKT